MKSGLFICVVLLAIGISAGTAAPLYQRQYIPPARNELELRGYPEKPFYQVGEPIRYTIVLEKNGKPVPEVMITGGEVAGEDGVKREFKGMSANPRTLEIAAGTRPGFIRIRWFSARKTVDGKMQEVRLPTGLHTILGGVMVEPEKVAPSTRPPADFDAFWEKQLAALRADKMTVLEKAKMRDIGIGTVYDMKISCVDSTPVSGYLFIPKGAEPKSCPAEIQFFGYGVRGVDLANFIFQCREDRKRNGKSQILFTVNAHGIKNNQPKAYYLELAAGRLKNYGNAASDLDGGPEKSYYRNMILRAVRAVEFVRSMPEWNGRLAVGGHSQGGYQALMAAGLDPAVTRVVALEPGSANMRALYGGLDPQRFKSTLPREYVPGREYLDAANMAKNIRCEVVIQVGMGDTIAQPSSMTALYNALASPRKRIEYRQNFAHWAWPFHGSLQTLANYPQEEK